MAIVRKTSKDVKPMTSQRVEQLMSMSDEDIDYSDIPELDDDFFANAKVINYSDKPKTKPIAPPMKN